MILATIVCSFFIYNLYRKWDESPILVDFKSEPVNIWEIPFPAVTICPEDIVLYSFPYDGENSCTMEISEFLMRSICAISDKRKQEMPPLSDGCDTNTLFKKAISRLLLYNYINSSFWDGKEAKIDILLTDFGICYTFNLLDPSQIFRDEVVQDFLVIEKADLNRTTNWKLATGYGVSGPHFPFRSFDAGIRDAYTCILGSYVDSNIDSCSASENGGYTIILHSPIEYPSSNKEVIIGPKNSSIIVYVKPKAIFADEEIESLSIETRRCFFEHESRLRFFRAYTESNCQIECLTNYTYSQCKCVPLHFPRTYAMRLCETAEEFECVRFAPEKRLSSEFEIRFQGSACNCLPNCNELVYEAQSTYSYFEGTYFEDIGAMDKEVGLFFVFFQDTQFWPSTRSRLYHVMDFIADCGCLMGLCMGVSFVSLIEMLYHCTIRHIPKMRPTHDSKHY